jgi:hypothetical protein
MYTSKASYIKILVTFWSNAKVVSSLERVKAFVESDDCLFTKELAKSLETIWDAATKHLNWLTIAHYCVSWRCDELVRSHLDERRLFPNDPDDLIDSSGKWDRIKTFFDCLAFHDSKQWIHEPVIYENEKPVTFGSALGEFLVLSMQPSPFSHA